MILGLMPPLIQAKTGIFVDEIPIVPIMQIRLRQSDQKLFIARHVRGIWTADLNVIVSAINESRAKVILSFILALL
ncbi:MAG: hypothetical protein ACJATA_000337 [Sphingobacteriales bacterium]|jgi:hypothetical protein